MYLSDYAYKDKCSNKENFLECNFVACDSSNRGMWQKNSYC